MKGMYENLDSICSIIAGQSPPSSTYNNSNNGLPFFQGKADFGECYPSVRNWCSEPIKISFPNDILLSVRAPVGSTNICEQKACIGRGLYALRSNKETNYKYLFYYLRSIERKISGTGVGSTFNAITLKDVKKIQIPLPPLPIQKKIAEVLDKADSLRQKRKESIAKLDELAQSIFLDMFGDPVTNPKGWEVKQLEEVCEFENGDRSKNYPNKEDLANNGIIFIDSSNIVNFKFTFNNIKYIKEKKYNNLNSGKCKKGNIIFTLRGNGLGKCCIFPFNQGFINAQLVIIRPDKICNNNFLLNQFCYKTMFKEIWKIGSGSAQPQLSVIHLKRLNIILPPLKLQQQFASRIEKIQSLKEQHHKSLSESDNLFNSFMQKSFKGSGYRLVTNEIFSSYKKEKIFKYEKNTHIIYKNC